MVYVLRVIDVLDLVVLFEEGYESCTPINELIDSLVLSKDEESYFAFKPYVVKYCDHFTLKVDNDELIYNVFVNQIDIFEGLQFNLQGD